MIGSRVMAVGDVHGQYDKLKKLMRTDFFGRLDRPGAGIVAML